MPVIQLTSLNQELELDYVALQQGAANPVPVTNATAIRGILGDLAALYAAVQFYTTADGDFGVIRDTPLTTSTPEWNFGTISNTGVATLFQTASNTGLKNDGSAATAWSPNQTDPDKDKDLRTAYHENIQKLSMAVFGSPQMVELFSDSHTIMLDIAYQIDVAMNNVNTSIDDQVVGEWMNSLILNYPERFALEYNNVVTVPPTPGMSYFVGLKAIGSVSTTNATVNIIMSAPNIVGSVIVTNAGANFMDQETVIISDPYGGSNLHITLTLTSAIAYDLNNTESGAFNAAIALLTGVAGAGVFDTIQSTDNMYTGLTTGGATGATISAVYNDAGDVLSLWVTSPGSGFVMKDIVTITGVAHVDVPATVITLAGCGNNLYGINPVQTAMLNGTLSVETAPDSGFGTPAPIELGDEIATYFTINSNSAQKSVTGDLVASQYVAQYVFVVEDTVVATPTLATLPPPPLVITTPTAPTSEE